MKERRHTETERLHPGGRSAPRKGWLSIVLLVVVVGVGLYGITYLLGPSDPNPHDDAPGTAGPTGVPDPARVNISSDLIHAQPFMSESDGLEGRRLATQHCQRCHMFVEPEALPKDVWQSFVFPRMGAFMGMHHAGVKTRIDEGQYPAEKQSIDDAGVYPPAAAMTLKQWQALVGYYMDWAPDRLDEPVETNVIEPRTALFQEAGFGYRQTNPNTTLIHIDENRQRLFVGDMVTTELSILRPAPGSPRQTDAGVAPVQAVAGLDLIRSQKIRMGSPPVHVRVMEDQLWVTNIGPVNPNDLPAGRLVVLTESLGKYATRWQTILTGLRRPTYASYADMNRDGLTDALISEYGNQLGAFTYYQAKEDGTYKKIELAKGPGSMASHIHDFNNDGWLDVAVVQGQGREGVHIHYNNGDGNFTPSYALPIPPHYGSSSAAFYDFNADGHLDILATNGDNGDYPAILKPHHGVRIYLNDGNNAFEEHYFFPMNGAFKALAEDFDLDGDLDIAAISMFPDFDGRPEEGFVYLENDGKLNFQASTITRVKEGRWLCMDTGDLDGDGDKDIVIGSFIRGPSAVPFSTLKDWENGELPGLVLWNTTK